MSTKALIDRVKPYAKGFSRTGTKGILNLVQRGQDLLFNEESDYMRFIPTDNQGFPAYLQTTDGEYNYNINSTTLASTLQKSIGGTNRTIRCKRVLKIFVDTSTNYDFNRRWIGDPYVIGYNNPYRTSNDRIRVADIPCRNEPALENTEALVRFPDNPGTTTDIYFCDFIWEPPRLTAETIPLVVPTLYEEAIEDYVLGTIEKYSNGKTGERLMRFFTGDPRTGEPSWIEKFQTEMDMGASIGNWKTELKEA